MDNPRRSFEFRLLDQADKIRLVLVGVFMVALYTAPRGALENYPVAASALGVFALYSIFTRFVLNWHSIRREGQVQFMAALLVCTDILCISVFVWAMGPAFRSLTTLLLVDVLFAASFFAGVELALVVGIAAGAWVVLGFTSVRPNTPWDVASGVCATLVIAWMAYALAEVPRRERAATDRIVKHLTEGVMLVTRAGEITVVNPRVEHMLGVRASDVTGLNVYDPGNHAALEPVAGLLEDVLEAEDGQFDIKARQLHIEDPTPLDIQVLTVPCIDPDGAVTAWVIVSKDVTEMLSSLRAKEESIAVVSHELRNRLVSVRAAAELLIRMSDRLTAEVRRETLRLLDTETRRLSRLVSRTLDAAAVEDGTAIYTFEPVRIGDLAQDACDCLRHAAREKGIELILEIEGQIAPVMADPARLDQAIQNLVENALKFTPRGGEVRVRVAPCETGVSISIADTGCGIPEDRLATIFEKFVTDSANANSGSPMGLGLGLFLCREIVRCHHGSMRVESVEGEGTTFTFTVPADLSPGFALGSETVEKQALARPAHG